MNLPRNETTERYSALAGSCLTCNNKNSLKGLYKEKHTGLFDKTRFYNIDYWGLYPKTYYGLDLQCPK
jgi:hypothetical protein